MAIPQLASGQLTRDVLSGYIKDFLDSLKGGKKQTRATYECALREFVRWRERDGRLLFAVDDVYRYKNYLTRLRELAPASVSTYVNALRQLCEYLHQHEVITYNPAKHVRGFVPHRTAGFEALTKPEVDRLIGSVGQNDRRGVRDTAIIRLMVEYGVAEIELTRLDAEDYVFIAASGALKMRGGKNGSKLLLGHDMTALMNRYLASRPKIGPKIGNEQPLFLSDGNRTRGMRMTTRGIRARVNHYLRLAGLFQTGSRKITPRVLRHTAAILMAGDGASADEIKYRMRFGSLAKAKEYLRQVAPATRVP